MTDDVGWPTPFMVEHGSGWVHRAADRPPEHRCQPPMRQTMIRVPFGGLTPTPIEETELVPHGEEPDGARGDIWRCNCRRDGQYWVIVLACDVCEAGGHGYLPAGTCTAGLAWRPITARRARRLVRRAERRSR